jgi:hypothetical protein
MGTEGADPIMVSIMGQHQVPDDSGAAFYRRYIPGLGTNP